MHIYRRPPHIHDKFVLTMRLGGSSIAPQAEANLRTFPTQTGTLRHELMVYVRSVVSVHTDGVRFQHAL
jgi:hypothetical protein